eukprot:s24_g23.t1
MPKPLFINIDGDALALDLAGPYKVRGRDIDLDDYKYITVAAYKCPKEYMDNKAFESVAKEFSMDEYEPSDVEDEYGMLEEEKGVLFYGHKEWLADCGLRHSRTAGGDPAGNSTAELGVKWAKSRVRALLRAASAEARDRPMAIQQATSSAWAKAFPYAPTTRIPATPFGHEVWFRAKNYKGTGEKKHDPTGAKWKRGWYRGPSYDVNRGHIILREDGGLTIAKSVKFNVVDPAKDLPDLLQPGITEDLLAEPEGLVPKGRLEGEIEFVAKMLLEKRSFENKDVMYLFEKLEELGNTVFRDAVAEDLVIKKVPKKGDVYGSILQFHDQGPVNFRPNLWHEVQPWEGDRVVMLLYTPRASKLKPEEIEELDDLGFTLAKEALKEPEPEDQEELIEDENIEIKRAYVYYNQGGR